MVLGDSLLLCAALLTSTILASIEVKRQDESQTTNFDIETSTFSLSSVPPTTQVITSVVTQSPTGTESNTPVTVVVTRTNSASQSPVTTQFTTSGRLTTFTTTRPATLVTIVGATVITSLFTSVLTSTPGADSTSSESGYPSADGAGATMSNGVQSNTDTGLSEGAKIGLGVGISLGIILLIALIALFVLRRRRKTRQAQADPGVEKDGTPVSELQNQSRPHEAGSTAIHELQVPPSELEAKAKKKQERDPAELEGDGPT